MLLYKTQTTNESFFSRKLGNPKSFDKPCTRTTEMYSMWFAAQGKEREHLKVRARWGFLGWSIKDYVPMS